MSWYKQDGMYWKRVVLHTKYDIAIIMVVMLLFMLIWKLFFDVGGYRRALLSALVLGFWFSTIIKFWFKLPHFNIPYTYSKGKKNFIYIMDIMLSTFGVYYYYFQYQ